MDVLPELAVQIACQSAPPFNPSFPIDPTHPICAYHALPWAVPQSGQRLEGQRLQTLWRHRDIPLVSIGTLHANCRKFMCARKARR